MEYYQPHFPLHWICLIMIVHRASCWDTKHLTVCHFGNTTEYYYCCKKCGELSKQRVSSAPIGLGLLPNLYSLTRVLHPWAYKVLQPIARIMSFISDLDLWFEIGFQGGLWLFCSSIYVWSAGLWKKYMEELDYSGRYLLLLMVKCTWPKVQAKYN